MNYSISKVIDDVIREAATSTAYEAVGVATLNATYRAVHGTARQDTDTPHIITNSIWDILNEVMNELE